MKKLVVLFSFVIQVNLTFGQHQIGLINQAVFYNIYESLATDTLSLGLVRLKNETVTRKIKESELSQFRSKLSLNVSVSARCDNYDRLGNVFLAFVPKGQLTYQQDSVERIEVARFITPFMNKNVQPNIRTYSFDVSQLVSVFQNQALLKKYDFWIELQISGASYAAQKQIKGCENRMDTYEGSLEFVTDQKKKKSTTKQAFIPVSCYQLINNYSASATDSIGKTVKSFSFETTEHMQDVEIYLITSNHGANEGGEEYVRRWHYVTLDGEAVLSYKPGGKSCEPYRKYNTQGNGIYERNEKSEEEWSSWNNWCPGDEVPTRKIALKTLEKGIHTITLSVPEAEFKNQEGYFPVSIYIIGSQK